MKRTIVILFTSLILFGCSDEADTPTKPVDDDFDVTKAMLVKQGMLEGINHSVSGTAKLYDSAGKYTLVFDPYMSQPGPDLKVYFSQDINASSYINLGPLKSTMGKQSYSIPGSPALEQYPYVHIWCEKYTVVFGRAALQ